MEKQEREDKIADKGNLKTVKVIIVASFALGITVGAIVVAIVLMIMNARTTETISGEIVIETMEIEEDEIEDEIEEIMVEEGETGEELLERIQGMMEDGDTTLTLLETLFPEDVIVAHEGSYYFFPIDESLAQNDYDVENLIQDEDGEVTYEVNGEVTSHKGIDVSRFQEEIDWEKVAADGVEFAMIRLGYRGYESGKLVVDDTFEYNIEGAIEAGLDVGVYFYTEAITVEEAIEEADFVLENLADYEITLPIILDVEESSSSDARSRTIDADERTEIAIAFCDRVEEMGYDSMIYGNLKSFLILMNLEELEGYSKWFAYFKFPLRFPYEFQIWQYTDSGTVDGIEGDVDLNIAFY